MYDKSKQKFFVYFSFIYLDILNMKTVVCQFVSPLDTQTTPVYRNLIKINCFFLLLDTIYSTNETANNK